MNYIIIVSAEVRGCSCGDGYPQSQNAPVPSRTPFGLISLSCQDPTGSDHHLKGVKKNNTTMNVKTEGCLMNSLSRWYTFGSFCCHREIHEIFTKNSEPDGGKRSPVQMFIKVFTSHVSPICSIIYSCDAGSWGQKTSSDCASQTSLPRKGS